MQIFCLENYSTVLLVLTLLAGGYSDIVTWRQCKDLLDRWRVVTPRLDTEATLLNLRACGVTTFNESSFDGLPNVTEMELYDNAIEYLDPAIFRSVPNLTRLELEFNRLEKIPVFGEHSLFPKLEELRLDVNHINAITDVRTFSAMIKLQTLYLDSNRISYIHPDVFKPMTNLMYLHLNFNKLRFIPETMFQLESLEILYLHHNLIEYVSPGAFLGPKLVDLQLNNNRLMFLPSNFVHRHMSASTEELGWFYFFDNPWDCACLLEQLVEVRRLGVKNYVSWKYDGNSPSCVYGGTFTCRREAPSALLLTEAESH